MDQTKVKDFARRVSQASHSEMTVILYDIILSDLESAQEALQKGDSKKFEKEMKHAGRFVSELIGGLDLKYTLCYDLRRLYIFVQKELIASTFSHDVKPLKAVKVVLEPLRESFLKISAQDTTGPVMKNTQQIYAGLTYGKGSLNEMMVDGNEGSRGFLA